MSELSKLTIAAARDALRKGDTTAVELTESCLSEIDAANALGARLFVGEGVMHVPQTARALDLLRAELEQFDEFALAGVHDLVSISGSLVLALAVTNGVLSQEEAWSLSRIDEHWQIEQWGEDEEAAASEAAKQSAFFDAVRFFRLSLR